jgi:hypothetical protein
VAEREPTIEVILQNKSIITIGHLRYGAKTSPTAMRATVMHKPSQQDTNMKNI